MPMAPPRPSAPVVPQAVAVESRPVPEPRDADASSRSPILQLSEGLAHGAHGGAAPRRDPRRGAPAGPDRARRPRRAGTALRRGGRQPAGAAGLRPGRARRVRRPRGRRRRRDASRRRWSSRSWGRASPAPARRPRSARAWRSRSPPGAMLPAGADVVVPAVWTDQGTVRVAVHAGPPAGSYVRRTGDDVAPGDPAVQVGTPIGPAQISLLAAVGRERVLVRPRPRIAVLCAGTELVDVGTTPGARPGRRRQQLRPGRGRPRRRRGGLPLGHPAVGPAPPHRGAGEPAAAQRPGAHRRHLRRRRVRHGAGGAGRARRHALPPGDDAPRARRRASAGWGATRSRSSASPASRWPRWSPSRCSSARRSGSCSASGSCSGARSRRSPASR